MSDESPGWAAIESVFEQIYPGVEPRHYASLPAMLGGPPLDGISAYPSSVERPHWHFVTYGFSELYAKANDDPAVSGFGFELTMRLAPLTGEPPAWAINFLQNLGRYVFRSGNRFNPGEDMDLNGPIAVGSDTAIHAALFAADPQADAIQTPNGEVVFVQVVGVTTDELTASQTWNTAGLLSLLAERSPLLITDLARASLMTEPAAQARFADGLGAEGSSCGLLFVDMVRVEAAGGVVHITLGANGLRPVRRVLPHRMAFGRGLMMRSKQAVVVLEPGDASRVDAGESAATITLSAAAVDEWMQFVQPVAGDHTFETCPGLIVTVVQSVIQDADGATIDTVG